MFSGRKIFRPANFIFMIVLVSHYANAQSKDGISTAKDAVYGSEGVDVLYTPLQISMSLLTLKELE